MGGALHGAIFESWHLLHVAIACGDIWLGEVVERYPQGLNWLPLPPENYPP